MIDSSEVKLHFLDYWRVIKLRMGLITLVFLLVMITAGVTVYFLPREYLARVSMEVRPDNYKPVDIFSGGSGRAYDPQFVATQFQILRKPEILYPVIEKLDLVKEYSGGGPRLPMQVVLAYLNNDLVLQEVRNTGLIEVGVYNTDPQLSANIANTIFTTYRDRRLDQLQLALEQSLKQFKDEVEKQRKVVEDAAILRAKIAVEQGVVDADPDSPAAPISNLDRSNISTESAVNEQRVKTAELRQKLAKIEKLRPEELMEALRTLDIEDQTVMQNLPEFQKASVEEANMLSSGLGENHWRVKAARAKREVHAKILSDALEGIRRAQANKLQTMESTLHALEENSAHTREEAIKDKNKSVDYTTAKAKYLQANKILEAAEMRLSAARMEKGIDIRPVELWQRAEPPLSPDKPRWKTYLFLAAIIGGVVGVGLAFFIEYLDTSVKTLDDVERFLQVPVLAVVPKGVPALIKHKGDHRDAEAYRILRANIEFNKPSPDAKTMTFISGGSGEGKSTTLNNLAYICAKGGYNVLVIDADLRRPTQHLHFDADNTFGLSDYLQGKASVDAITKTTKIDNLSFIPAGIMSAEAPGILSGQRMHELIGKVKSQYDLIFFDAPPILGVSDGAVLASEMDMTAMVVQHRRFPRAMLQRVKNSVEQVGGSLVGVVLNQVDTRHDEGYAYYNAYSDYYTAPTKPAQKRSATPQRRPAPAAVGTLPGTDGHGDY